MKRCPECGFRANDTVCPLCGVRMRDLPGAAREIKTHTHKQTGERCALPNQKREPVRPVEREQPGSRMQECPERKTEKKTPLLNISPKLLSILAVVLFALLRSCMG